MLLIGYTMGAELQEVPGTGVSLVPPPGWQEATQFTGFIEQNTGSSILVLGDGAGVNEIIARVPTLDDARVLLRSQGIEVAARTEFRSASGHLCLLLSGTQRQGAMVADKWLALCGGQQPTMVTLQAPQSAAFPREQAEAALRSIHLTIAPSIEAQLAALPFTVTPVAPFRMGQVFAGTSLVLPGGPPETDPALGQPSVVVASQLGGPPFDPASDPCAVSLQYLGKSTTFHDATVSRQSGARVAGRSGCLLAGTYTGHRGAQRAFLHYLAITPSGYTLRLVAAGDPARLAPLEPQVAEMAAGMVAK